ncbi:TIR domain-containing protein [Zoogloea sp.]|uniref:TIR domain-containing protein n=1 Tax=Zoogloea sp. TaxID=49181 RepID=UPI002627B204|nr:TIR domain-containing protein [Zoogloea sp.]
MSELHLPSSIDAPAPVPPANGKPPAQRGTSATWLFGYDIFISFALGAPPRGTQSYASDLARQLRERDFTVFYSEDEAAPGTTLNDTLRKALKQSRILVVIANRGTLEEPRWVRAEVEEFRQYHPTRPIIPISIEGALKDHALLDTIRPWLNVGETIWVDDTQEAVKLGIASREVVQRLSLAPKHLRAAQRWRATVVGAVLILAISTGAALWNAKVAHDNALRASISAAEAKAEEIKARKAEARALGELRASTGLRLRAESSAMLARLRPEPDERAMQQLLAAQQLTAPGRPLDAEAEGDLLAGLRGARHLLRLVSGNAEFLTMAVSATGRRLATVADDTTLQLWDAATGKPIGASLPAHLQTVRSLAFSPDGTLLVTGSKDTTMRLWEVADDGIHPALAFPLTGHTDEVRAVAFSPDGKLIASGSNDNTARLWDVRTSMPIGQPLAGHSETVIAVAFSPDSRQLVTASYDRTLQLWDVRTGKPHGRPLVGHVDSLRSVAFSPDGKRIVSGAWDNNLMLWNVASGRPIGKPMRGHQGLVRSVAFSSDGKTIVSSSDDGSVRLWDGHSGRPVGKPLLGHTRDVTGARFIERGNPRIVSVGLDGSLRLWNPDDASPIGEPLARGKHQLASLTLSADGERMAAGGQDLRLHLWKISSLWKNQGANEKLQPVLDAPILSLAFSPDGKRLATGSFDGSLRLVDGRSGAALGPPINTHSGAVSAIAWSPDGKQIATGSWDTTLRIWDAASGAAVGEPLSGHDAWIAALAFSPDGRSVVSASADTRLRHWNVATGQLIGRPMLGHDNWVLAVAFSPDGSLIVSGGADDTVRRWNAATGEPIGDAMEGHANWVTSVNVSPKSQHIVSGSWDRSLRLWRADSGVPVGQALDGHADAIQYVAFSSNGEYVRSVSRSGALHLWAAPLRWPGMLCAKLTRNMSPGQWKSWVSSDIEYGKQCSDLPIAAD